MFQEIVQHGNVYIVHFGWAAVLLATVAGIVTMKIWPMIPRQSFSENIARYRSSALAFALWMTVVTVLFYWFLLGWLGPERSMGATYYILAWAMFILQLVLAWVPATKKLSLLVHNIASYVVVVLMPLLLISLATSSAGLSGLQLTVLAAFMIYMVTVMFMFFFVPRARSHFLWFQMGMTVAAWIAILTLAYAG